MVHICHVAHKSTGGHLTIGQLAPRGTSCQQEETMEPQQEMFIEPQQLEPVEPQHEEPTEPQQREELAQP
jgi:hypothetical protein